MNRFLSFGIVTLALSLNVLVAADLSKRTSSTSEHDLSAVSDERSGVATVTDSFSSSLVKGILCENSCHEDATCTVIDSDVQLFKCKCNGNLIGDGVTACEMTPDSEDVSTSAEEELELERDLRKKSKKRKKKSIKITASPTAFPTASPTAAPANICFPGDVVVLVKHKGEVKMRDVGIGDLVLGMDGKYSPIIAFMHQDFQASSQYVRIYTNDTSTPLDISGHHFVYRHDQKPVLPAFLQTEDVLLGADGMKPLLIVKIETLLNKGVFAPLTASGTIAVNGIVSSNYAFGYFGSLSSPDHVTLFKYNVLSRVAFNHVRYSPLRLATLGISPFLGKLSVSEGRHYLTYLYHVTYKWMTPGSTSTYALRALGTFLWYSIVGSAWLCYGIECLVGPSMGPAVGAALVTILAAVVVNKMRKKEGNRYSWKVKVQ